MDPSVSYVPAFQNLIVRLYQEDADGIRSAVRNRTIQAKSDHWDRMGGLELTPVTGRHQATPYTPGTMSRRRVTMTDWAGSERFDKLDEVKMMIDPRNEMTQNLTMAWRRTVARTIIDAARGNATSVDNQEATSTVALPGSQQIANGGTGLTFAKLRQLNRLFDNVGVPRDGRRHFAISAYGLEDLMADSQFTSGDYNAMGAIANGGAALVNSGTVMGLRFHLISDAIPDDSGITGATVQTPTNPILPKTGNIRTCVAWHHDAVGLSLAKDISVEVDRRPDLLNLWQALVQGSLGAVRILDAGVVTVDIDESA